MRTLVILNHSRQQRNNYRRSLSSAPVAQKACVAWSMNGCRRISGLSPSTARTCSGCFLYLPCAHSRHGRITDFADAGMRASVVDEHQQKANSD